MNKEVLENKEVSDCLYFLLHCSLKDTEFETQREQFYEVYNYIEKLEETLKEIRNRIKDHVKEKSYNDEVNSNNVILGILDRIDKVLGDE